LLRPITAQRFQLPRFSEPRERTIAGEIVGRPQAPSNLPLPLSPPNTHRMRPPSRLASSALRTWTKHPLPRASAPAIPITASQSRAASTTGETTTASSFDSPFGRTHEDAPSTTKVPDFSHYMSKRDGTSNRVFQYFMVGTMGLLSAAGAKATVQGEHYISV
jgi:hypothetical protein